MRSGPRALPLDLDRCRLIRDLDRRLLVSPEAVAELVTRLGLNDEDVDEYPAELRRNCGQGLRIWQYPNQFAPYLVALGGLSIRSYMELGVRHGGAFIATVEYLDRLRPLDFAVGVDLLPAPALEAYHEINRRARSVLLDAHSPAFRRMLAGYGEVDLVFVDSLGDEDDGHRGLERLRDRANVIALHDIASDACPGVARVWKALVACGEYACREFVDQYPSVGGSYMGIGLAVRKDRRSR